MEESFRTTRPLLSNPQLAIELSNKAAANREKKGRGYQGLIDRRLGDLKLLLDSRGEFAEGCRANATWILALFLRMYGFNVEDVKRTIEGFRSRFCKPTLSRAEALGRV